MDRDNFAFYFTFSDKYFSYFLGKNKRRLWTYIELYSEVRMCTCQLNVLNKYMEICVSVFSLEGNSCSWICVVWFTLLQLLQLLLLREE